MKTIFLQLLREISFLKEALRNRQMIRLHKVSSGLQNDKSYEHALKYGYVAILLVILLLLFTRLQAAQIRLVPDNYATIQLAVNAANEGDTVLVNPGIYFENVRLRGRNIVLTSRYFMVAKPVEIIQQTIINGSQPMFPDTASCILIFHGETNATIVQGFTITGGKGTVWNDPAGAGLFREGGGILTEASSPIIRHNIIENNTVTPGGTGLVSVGGGGIRSGGGAVRIENNTIIHNEAEGYGGGIVLNYCPNAVVQNNVIAYNTGGKVYGGGGFWATGQNQNTVVTLKNNTIAFNQSPSGSGPSAGRGGGAFVFSIKVNAENNIVWGNTQAIGKQVYTSGGQTVLTYNCIQDNTTGTGTITSNPMFRDTTSFVLEAGSPAIDAGNPAETENDFNRNGMRAAFPARGTMRNDLGAFGGPNVRNPASPQSFLAGAIFSKVLNSPVVSTLGDSRSVNWIDVDNDHDLDLFISNGPEEGENNFLYKNNGTGGFEAVVNDPVVMDGQPSDGATWADFDNDGDNDCFVVNWYDSSNLCYTNNGDGSFTRITTGAMVTDGGFSETASWGDYDSDGKLDLYVTNSGGNKRNFLYHNLGSGNFEKVTTGNPVTDAATSRSVNWTDYDLDGDVDLFITNEGSANEKENLYRNDGGGTFTKITAGPLVNNGGKTMSSSWGDYDNDGNQDVFLANSVAQNSLFQNHGDGDFTKLTTGAPVTGGARSFGSNWADIDNDGDLDLFATNAFGSGMLYNYLFINNGDSTFVIAGAEAPSMDLGWSYGCAFGDFDRDGDLDLGVANCYQATQPDYLYENHASETANHWLEIECIGVQSNRSAIGTMVRVQATLNGKPVSQMREISAQSGYCGQNQMVAHFGLADAVETSISVHWPSGLDETFANISSNQFLQIVEGQGITSAGKQISQTLLHHMEVVPNPFSEKVIFSWQQVKEETVQLQIVDIQGRMIVSEKLHRNAGKQTWIWNGKNASGRKLPAGSYIVRLQQESKVIAKQVVKLE